MNANEFKYQILDYTRKINESTNLLLTDLGDRYQLSALQLRVLIALSKEERMAIGKLADTTLIANANLTAICKKLETVNIVNRVRDINDDRKVLVSLTNKGKEVIRDIDKYYTEKISIALDTHKEEYFKEVLAAIEKVSLFIDTLSKGDWTNEYEKT